jgi:DnaJ-class molecular chaperone
MTDLLANARRSFEAIFGAPDNRTNDEKDAAFYESHYKAPPVTPSKSGVCRDCSGDGLVGPSAATCLPCDGTGEIDG